MPLTKSAEGIFGEFFLVKNLEHNSGISVHGPLRPLSLSTPWLGMILILPLGVLVQVHRNGYFLRRPPAPPTPPVLGDSGLVRLARVSPHPPASRAPPQKAPKAW